MKKKLLAVLAFFAAVALLTFCSVHFSNKEKHERGDIGLYFFNAGDADAELIFSDDMAVLIDTGEKGFGSTILEFLDSYQIKKIDYMIITHFDKDHVGGAAEVLNNIEVEHVMQGNYPKESSEYSKYLKALESKNIEPETITKNKEFAIGGVRFVVDAPSKEFEEKASNNSSLIVEAYYIENRFVFMGDAENARIQDYLSKTQLSGVDLIKMPYHGRTLALTDEMLDQLDPKNAIVSAAAENEDKSTAKSMFNYGTKAYYTYNGDIFVSTNGDRLSIVQEN